MSALDKNHLVTKRNVLNEIRANSMTLQELRFFSIYLSKIFKDKPETRVVRFAIDDFKAIMELGRIDIKYMKTVTDSLLGKVVNVPNEKTGGYEGFQLFKKCKVDKDDTGNWFIQIDAHDDALPLMFDYKTAYFSYKVDNVLRMKSPNQLRMYELLKQYEKIGWRSFSIIELKEFLGIEKDKYPRFGDFKIHVLNVCQNALEEYTDIKFTYEPYGKRGKSGKILNLKFSIKKNEDYIDQLTLAEFIAERTDDEGGDIIGREEYGNRIAEILTVYRDLKCGEKFSELTDDEYLELNDKAADYMLSANRTEELDVLNLTAFVAKHAQYTNRQKPKHYYNYLLNAVKNNYAGA